MDLKDAMGHLASKDAGHPDVTAASLEAEAAKASGAANVSVEPATPGVAESILGPEAEEPDDLPPEDDQDLGDEVDEDEE